MAWGLPDLKKTLAGFYQENLQPTIETKSQEFKLLLQSNINRGVKTQKALIAIALAIFLLLALAFFWKDGAGIQWKYLCLGILIAYPVCYVIALKQN